MEDKKRVEYGNDDLTVSINKKDADKKTEDWHSDFDGRITIDGKMYYLNLYDHYGNGSWLKGKAKLAPPKDGQGGQQSVPSAPPAAQENIDDDIPF
jgi:hypothetical protein